MKATEHDIYLYDEEKRLVGIEKADGKVIRDPDILALYGGFTVCVPRESVEIGYDSQDE